MHPAIITSALANIKGRSDFATPNSWEACAPALERAAEAVANRFGKTPAEREELKQIALLSLLDSMDSISASAPDAGREAARRLLQDVRDHRAEQFLSFLRQEALCGAAAPLAARARRSRVTANGAFVN